MTTVNRAISLYIDSAIAGGKDALLDTKLSVPVSEKPRWMQSDKFSLQLWFRDKDAEGGASTAAELVASYSLVLTGKESADITGGDLLFSCSSWAKSGTGDDIYYAGTLDLNTAEIAALFTDNTADSIDIACDLEYRDLTDTERITWRFTITLFRQVYAGETAPSALTLPPLVLTAAGGSQWQVGVTDDGQFQLTRVT